MSKKVDDAIVFAQTCRECDFIEVPISLWSREEIDELYEKLPADLLINPEGLIPGCVRIVRIRS